MNLNQVTLPVNDLSKAIEFYRLLGFEQIVSDDGYARLVSQEGGAGATFSLDLIKGYQGENGVTIYFECDNLDETLKELKEKGLVFETDLVDQARLWLACYLRYPSGNNVCLHYAG